ncbi:MAG: hypothetical protein NTW75_02305 [Planctomycetales bacterium]|jgi:hypothetical protein|nr:hypothetical protein [Planctomycetales bacterium]
MFDESLWNVTHGNSLDETASSIVPRGRPSGGRYNIVELSLGNIAGGAVVVVPCLFVVSRKEHAGGAYRGTP